MEHQYFIINEGYEEQQGPFSKEQLLGNVKGSTLVWRKGLESWIKATELEELKDIVMPAPPNDQKERGVVQENKVLATVKRYISSNSKQLKRYAVVLICGVPFFFFLFGGHLADDYLKVYPSTFYDLVDYKQEVILNEYGTYQSIEVPEYSFYEVDKSAQNKISQLQQFNLLKQSVKWQRIIDSSIDNTVYFEFFEEWKKDESIIEPYISSFRWTIWKVSLLASFVLVLLVILVDWIKPRLKGKINLKVKPLVTVKFDERDMNNIK